MELIVRILVIISAFASATSKSIGPTGDAVDDGILKVGRSLLNFIQQFLQVFSEVRSAPLFITGESYAGKYIPAFGHYIHNNQKDSMPINLKGLAIGDGRIDPPNNFHNAELVLQHGFLDFDQAAEVEEADAIARKYWEDGDIENFKKAKGGFILLKNYADLINVYNYMDDQNDDDGYIEVLNRQEVKYTLHVGTLPYDNISFKADVALANDRRLSVKPWLEELLDHYGVMCYNGQLDVLIAYGNLIYMYRNMTWSNVESYRKAKKKIVNDMKNTPTLYVKEGGNFVDVVVRKAGHMVPKDQPEYAKMMIDMFIDKFK